MKKLILSAALAASLAAAPAIAQEAEVDPFISTQGEGLALGVIGGMTLLVLIAAADSSSGTD